nr:hypothetical protein [uncultured Catonella sp.]
MLSEPILRSLHLNWKSVHLKVKSVHFNERIIEIGQYYTGAASYYQKIRMTKALELLFDDELSVVEIAKAVEIYLKSPLQ